MTAPPPVSRRTQPQRTGLAWTRTALAALGLSGLAFRAALGHHRPLDVVTGVLAGVAAIAVYGLGRYRGARAAEPIPGAVAALAIAGCLVASLATAVAVAIGR